MYIFLNKMLIIHINLLRTGIFRKKKMISYTINIFKPLVNIIVSEIQYVSI